MLFSHFCIWGLFLVSILLMLLRPGGIAEAYWIAGGAALLILLGLLPWASAGHALYQSLDVDFFLIGMMILSELAEQTGVFSWLTTIAAQSAAGSAQRLFLLIYLAGVVVTTFLSNDATAVVLTPAVLTLTRKLELPPAPYLLSCAFIANAASFVLPISNPANLVFYARSLPALVPWLSVYFLPSLVSIGVTYGCLRLLLRHDLRGEIKRQPPHSELTGQGQFALMGLFFTGLILLGASASGLALGLPTFIAAALTATLLSWRNRSLPLAVLRRIFWSILPLVGGLFILVQALQTTGLISLLARGAQALQHSGLGSGYLAAGFIAALLCNLTNNLPIGLLGGALLQNHSLPDSLTHALLLGVNLGPNLSVTGSLATVLWLIVLRREQVTLSAWEFFRIGVITMPLSLAAAILAPR